MCDDFRGSGEPQILRLRRAKGGRSSAQDDSRQNMRVSPAESRFRVSKRELGREPEGSLYPFLATAGVFQRPVKPAGILRFRLPMDTGGPLQV